MIETLPLIVGEKEQLVFPHRTTEGAAEHVPAQAAAGQEVSWSVELVLPLVGVENVVAEELPRGAMELIGARFDGCVDDAALEIAEFSRSIGGNEVEFLDGVGRGGNGQIVFRSLVVIHAVENEVIRLLAVAVDRRAPTAIGIVAGV